MSTTITMELQGYFSIVQQHCASLKFNVTAFMYQHTLTTRSTTVARQHVLEALVNRVLLASQVN